MKKTKRIAIVATSPLQIMLSHKICEMYNPSYVKCFIMTYNSDNRYEKCEKLATNYCYDVQAIQMAKCSSRWMIMKNCLTSIFCNEMFDIVIQGMFSIVYFYSFSIKLLRNGGTLIITDDGTATFQLEDFRFMETLLKSPVLQGIFLLMTTRKIQHKLYYTIFNNVKSNYYELKTIDFHNKDTNFLPHGIYFLGTFKESFVSMFNPQMTEQQYRNLIARTVIYIRENFSNEEIQYTPHGRESELYALEICKQWTLNYLPSEVSVEVDYPNKGYYPKVIVGFMSTALFTLKAMYPLAQVIDIQPINMKFNLHDTLEKINQTEDIMGISRVYVNV